MVKHIKYLSESKKTYFVIMIILIFLLCFAIISGFSNRKTLSNSYPNHCSDLVKLDKDYKMTFLLHKDDFNQNGIIGNCIIPLLNNAPIVAKCKPTSQATQQHESSIQDLYILNVYKGSKTLEGKTIHYMMPINFNHELKCFCRSFVNYMNINDEYLVFVYPYGYTKNNPDGYNYNNTYIATDTGYMTYFDLTGQNKKDVILSKNLNSTYDVAMNNEVFADSEDAINSYYLLKEKIINQYVKIK